MTYGNTTRKYRPLDRDVIVLGRASSCDLNLVGAEVSPIHCLLLRCLNGGWRVRHFGGRIGTLVNGKPIQEAVVEHDDNLQVGSFSFKMHLPPPFRRPGLTADTPPDSAEACHLRRSRRNLVRLALNLRRRCRETAAELAQVEGRLRQQEQDVATLRETSRSRQQALDALRGQREAEERSFLLHCQALDRNEAALNERLRKAEEELARQRTEVEAAAALVRGETPSSDAGPHPGATPTLRERLARVQKLKSGLALLRNGDSAPGASQEHRHGRFLSDG